MRALRRKIATDLGVVVPPVRTRDNLDLPLRTYAIRLFGVEVARGGPPHRAAIGDRLDAIPGTRTQEPVFGLAAVWARWSCAARPSSPEPPSWTASVLTTHLAEVVRAHARLLSFEDVRTLTDAVKRSHPVVVEELMPAQLSLGEVQRVLQALLEEGVSIRDLVRIFEALSLRLGSARTPTDSSRRPRRAGPGGRGAVRLGRVAPGDQPEPGLEQRLLEGLRVGDEGAFLTVDVDLAQGVLTQMAALARQVEDARTSPRCWPARRSCVWPSAGW